jgi:arsenite-transporting ATPase
VLALDRPLLFFGGKGGVGKTTLAVGRALQSASGGHRTLLVSTDPAHSTADALGTVLGSAPTAIEPSLWAVEIDPGDEADRYIAEVKERIADTVPPRLVAEVERHFDIARLSPGAEEAALFDRFTKFMDQVGTTYDRIVFDTAPLGHTLRLLTLPEQLQAWMRGLIERRRKVGVLQRMWENVRSSGHPVKAEVSDDPVLAALEERRARFIRARNAITDPERAGFVFVVLPEWLALAETERGVATLDRHDIPIAAVIANRVVSAGAEGQFAAERRAEQSEVLQAIDQRLARFVRLCVRQFDGDVRGVDALRRVGAALQEGDAGASR